jgi:uroporphyrinogen-III decarboxylase
MGILGCLALTPFTIFAIVSSEKSTYMIEGGSSKTFANTKKMLFNEPKALHLLLDKLAHSKLNRY